MAIMKVERADGELTDATYIRHLRTLVWGGGSNTDLDLFRLADGTEIVCESPSNDGRAIPVERPGETAVSALFIE